LQKQKITQPNNFSKSDSLIYILYFRKLPLLFLLYSVFNESNQMSQPDFLYELFEDFMDDPANQVFSMDNGLVCRWMTGQAKIASTACVMTQAKSPTLSYRLCYNLPWVVTPKIELHTKQTVVKTEHFTT